MVMADSCMLRQAHFSFFGPIASVALSYDNEALLALLDRQQDLHSAYRRLHYQYAAALGSGRKPGVCRAKLKALEKQVTSRASLIARVRSRLTVSPRWQLSALLASRKELRGQLAAPSHCTGHAFVVFRRLADAARCVRHFELIRRHEREGVADNVDFRQARPCACLLRWGARSSPCASVTSSLCTSSVHSSTFATRTS